MGTIFSGVGLISGMDITSIVDQLIALDARPRDNLVKRIGTIDAQRTAMLNISAQIAGVLSRARSMKTRSYFETVKATSSKPDILGVTTGAGVTPGSYSFLVKQLASTHQLISRGYSDTNASVGAGRVSIESAQARVNSATLLDQLNGYRGVQRGSFELTDHSGAKAVIDLRDAATLNDVVSKINSAGLNIRAELQGDHLQLNETSGVAGATLRVRELDSGHTAADLGFGPGRLVSTDGALSGSDLVYLAGQTPLKSLNDGVGVRIGSGEQDFSITSGASTFNVSLRPLIREETALGRLNHGAGVNLGRIRVTTYDDSGSELTQEVDLTGLKTVGEVKNALAGSLEGVTLTLADNKIIVTNNASGQNKTIKIEDITGNAARDLGIAGESATGRIDGRGVLETSTLADVVAAINHASGNDGSVVASIDGARLKITGPGELTFASLSGSQALQDLGFADETYTGVASGARLLAGVNSTLLSSLNGGAGVAGGVVRVETAAGAIDVDLTDAESLRDVIERINAEAAANGLAIEAGVDATGLRLTLQSLDGVTPLTVSDVSGDLAAALGLAGSGTSLRGANLQKQYISENTKLSELNQGRGASLGKIKITNSAGVQRSFDLTGSTAATLGDVITRINSDPTFGVTARINDTGDGLLIEDHADGAATLKIEDESGQMARDLNLLGPAKNGVVDGSFEQVIELGPNDTLADLASRINSSGRLASASIINDGSGVSPYRLQISASASGAGSELIIDGAEIGLDVATMTRAQDAKVLLGGATLISSATNSISNIVPGLNVDLNSASDQPVEVTVSRTNESVLSNLDGIVSALNTLFSNINEMTKFDPQTEQRGILLGDNTTQIVESRLTRLVTGRIPGATGSITRLAQIGIGLSTVEDGGQLSFDAEKFKAAFEADPEGVIKFFTDSVSGAAAYLEKELSALSETSGLLPRREDSLEKQRDLLQDRVTQLTERLARKRERLTRQFNAMEQALAQLQSQQSALGQIAAP